jgi:2,3-bisphosphoglycerate-dependent phosphoglycerate mutase
MTRLVFVRHGQACCNVDRTIEGLATCRGLSELGRSQSSALGRRLQSEGFRPDVIMASPISRAKETAEIITRTIGMRTDDIAFDNGLEEVRPGEAEGMTWDQYSAFYGTTEGWDPNVPFAPGAEAWSGFARRVSDAIDRAARTHAGKTVLVVAHGGVIDASLFHYFGLNPEVQSPIDFETSNTSITEWERRTFTPPDQDEVHRWRLLRYNDASHLAGLFVQPHAPSAVRN